MVVAVFLFTAIGQAQSPGPCTSGSSYCLFISDFHNQTVQLWTDNGATGIHAFIPRNAGAGEGLSCLSGSANAIYVADYIDCYISVFNLTNGALLGQTPNFASCSRGMASLNADGYGTKVYAAEYDDSTILELLPVIPPQPPWLTLAGSYTPANSHDAGVGPNGNVYATQNADQSTGIQVYDSQLINSLGQYLPMNALNNAPCANFGTPATEYCWYNLGGTAWDAHGNLWVASQSSTGHGVFEFAPPAPGNQYYPYAIPLNFAPDLTVGGGPVGIAIAPSNSVNAGDIIVANVFSGDVPKVLTASCTGSVSAPGTCMSTIFIPSGVNGFNGNPKYPVYYTSCPNPDNNGYLEICKQSNPQFPVSGIFDFTVTVPFFSSGSVEVPVGECSGAVHVPSGQVTVTEAPTVGDLVSDVTACSYNLFGQCVPDLISWTPPDLYATVPVNAGGVSEETLATFTNYAASPGQLKVCKIAGMNTPVGTEFTFTVTGLPSFQLEAGPADQGGFCELVGTFAVNTPVTIAETPNPPYTPTSITVSQGQLSQCQPQSNYCTVATIGPGITEVSFTNTKQSKRVACLACR